MTTIDAGEEGATPTQVVEGLLEVVPDFPRPGIRFQNVVPVVASAEGLRAAVELLAAGVVGMGGTVLLGMEARGFVFGAALAQRLGCGLLLARKPGKLPLVGASRGYGLEYGEARLELAGVGVRGQRVVVVDDLLATGGTAAAAGELVRELGGEVAGYAFLVELAGLGGRERLGGVPVYAGVLR